MQPKYLNELIDLAAKAAGSDSALARELEVGRSRISDWRTGRATCSPEDQALMAGMAGLEADAWGARAMVEKHAGTTKGAKLEAVLKKALLVTGAVVLSSSVHAAAAIESVSQAGTLLNTMYLRLRQKLSKIRNDRKFLFQF